MYIGVSNIDTKPYYQVYLDCGSDKNASDFKAYVENIYASKLGEKHASSSYYDKTVGYYYIVNGNSVSFSPYQTSQGQNRVNLIIQRMQDRR